MANENPATPPAEPVLSVGSAAAAVGAVLTLLISFGVDLTESQVKAILGVVLIGGPVLLAAITRGKVFSPATVAKYYQKRD